MNFFSVRLQNGEKRSELKWVSWFDTVPDSPSPSVRSSIASHLSVFAYNTPNDDLLSIYKSRSIPPSPSSVRSHSTTLPQGHLEEAHVGKNAFNEILLRSNKAYNSIIASILKELKVFFYSDFIQFEK